MQLPPTCSVSWDCRDSTRILSTSMSAAEGPSAAALSFSLATAEFALRPLWPF